MFKQCKYVIPVYLYNAASFEEQKIKCYVRCLKKDLFAGTHLHLAPFPSGVYTYHNNSYICWRSSNGPDYNVDYLQDTAFVYGNDD